MIFTYDQVNQCFSFREINLNSDIAYRLLTQSNIFPELEIMCTSWPTAATFGCMGGEAWKQLHSSMTFSDSANCERLCRAEEEMGCCYLKTGVGCYWKPGGHSGSASGASATAVTCRNGYTGLGKNQIVCFKNQPWHFKAAYSIKLFILNY